MFDAMRIILICIVLTAVNAGVLAQKAAVTEIGDFDGMAGCWEIRDAAKKLLITEQWMSPSGTSILGMNRTVKNGKTVGYEFMRIESRDDGIYFVSRPKENPEDTAFKMTKSTPNEVVFENGTHDFPQRIVYRLKGTTMIGRIEGINNGKLLGLDFPFRKVKCV